MQACPPPPQVDEAVRSAIQKARSIAAYVTKPDNKVSRTLKDLLRQVREHWWWGDGGGGDGGAGKGVEKMRA